MASKRFDNLSVKDLVTTKELNVDKIILGNVDLMEYLEHRLNQIQSLKSDPTPSTVPGPPGPPGESVVGPQGPVGPKGREGKRGLRGKPGIDKLLEFPEFHGKPQDGDTLVWRGDRFEWVPLEVEAEAGVEQGVEVGTQEPLEQGAEGSVERAESPVVEDNGVEIVKKD